MLRLFTLLCTVLLATSCAHSGEKINRNTASSEDQTMTVTCLGKELDGDLTLRRGPSFWDRGIPTSFAYYSEVSGKYQVIAEQLPSGDSKITIKYQADSATTSILATGLNHVEFEIGWTPKRSGDLTTCVIKR
jgi:hypothetical protein